MKFPTIQGKPVSIIKYILANIVLSLLILVVVMHHSAFQNWKNFEILFLWSLSICITQWTGLELVYKLIDNKINWLEKPVLKTLLQIVAFLLYSTGAFILVQLLNFSFWLNRPPAESWPQIVPGISYALIISFVISVTFTAIGFFKAWKASFLQAEKLKLEMLSYKYESLRNQINPHFLFNSLNVLTELVYDDQGLAVKFIRQLSDLFRYVLDSRDKELVPLSEEIAFIRSYIFLLKTRFEDKLHIHLDLQAEPGDYLVPMTLQLLIENAVKHNEVSEAFPLEISIRRSDGYLIAENSLKPKNVGEDSKKTGLKNISQQFAFFSDKPIEILPTESSFVVKIPIIKSVTS